MDLDGRYWELEVNPGDDSCRKESVLFLHPEKQDDHHHLEGAPYAGWLGAGAGLGQQDAAMKAAAAAMKASFIGILSWFLVGFRHELHAS